jgi:glycosyltransferase involved in cell wall biosynthesis
MSIRTLALTRYGTLGASSRYRFLQYLPYLSQQSIEVEVRPLLDNAYVARLYSGHGVDVPAIARAYAQRLVHLVRHGRYDLIWIEKEALPFVPGWVETVLLGSGTRYVLDYDDAVFHNYDRHPRRLVRALLRAKYDRVMRGSTLVVAGNDYIAERARRSGAANVEIVPTVVDTNRYPMVACYDPDEIAVGWIGTPVTAKFLDVVPPILSRLGPDERVRFVAIGSGPLSWATDRVEVVPWSSETEVESLRSLSIGIMPIPDNPFERGKSGLKLLQYMAVGLPVIASPVGVNRKIVEPGVNGFLCETTDEWVTAIRALAADAQLRQRMGQAGRRKVEALYSLQASAPRLASLLRRAAEGRSDGDGEAAS